VAACERREVERRGRAHEPRLGHRPLDLERRVLALAGLAPNEDHRRVVHRQRAGRLQADAFVGASDERRVGGEVETGENVAGVGRRSTWSTDRTVCLADGHAEEGEEGSHDLIGASDGADGHEDRTSRKPSAKARSSAKYRRVENPLP
jgi:hypothetical protein